MATHSSILAWRIPWTEEPGGYSSIGSQRIGHNWSYWAHSMHSLLNTWFFKIFFFFDADHFKSLYLICYNIVSVLCFGFLAVRHVDLSSPTRAQTYIPCIPRWSLNHWATREVLIPDFLHNTGLTLVMMPSCIITSYNETFLFNWTDLFLRRRN